MAPNKLLFGFEDKPRRPLPGRRWRDRGARQDHRGAYGPIPPLGLGTVLVWTGFIPPSVSTQFPRCQPSDLQPHLKGKKTIYKDYYSRPFLLCLHWTLWHQCRGRRWCGEPINSEELIFWSNYFQQAVRDFSSLHSSSKEKTNDSNCDLQVNVGLLPEFLGTSGLFIYR